MAELGPTHNSSYPDEPCWCLHCERVYKYGEWRAIDGQFLIDEEGNKTNKPLQFCPYEDCDGDTVMDAQPWSWVRENGNEHYPERPRRNKFYPLYPYPEGHKMEYKPYVEGDGSGEELL